LSTFFWIKKWIPDGFCNIHKTAVPLFEQPGFVFFYPEIVDNVDKFVYKSTKWLFRKMKIVEKKSG
jgi:hypothetical protein